MPLSGKLQEKFIKLYLHASQHSYSRALIEGIPIQSSKTDPAH